MSSSTQHQQHRQPPLKTAIRTPSEMAKLTQTSASTTTATLVPTSTASPGNPLPGIPGDLDGTSHGFLWYVSVLITELALIAAIAILTKYTVQYRSGLNEPDKIRRIWARAPEIRFQPVKKPLVFSVATSFGAQTVIHALSAAVLSLVGFDGSHGSMLGFVIGYLALGFSALISILVYRVSGGTNWKICAVSTLGFDWFMTGVVLNWAHGLYLLGGETISKGVMFLIILAITLAILLVFQIPFYLWGAYKRLPATARLIYNNSVVPNWVKLDRTILMAAGPLAVIHIITLYFQTTLFTPGYWSRVVSALAVIVLLFSSALASIISVNRALLANEFQWQWRAFLTPAIPLGIVDIVLRSISLLFGYGSFRWFVYQIPHLFLSYGSSGALGAIVYLKLAEQYAQTHIDEDVLAQDDLLAEFEEDEDNEELEV